MNSDFPSAYVSDGTGPTPRPRVRREPDYLSRCDRILDADGRLLGAIYYTGAEEMANFRAWFDQLGD